MIRVIDHVVFLSQKVDRDRFFDHYLTQKLGRPGYSVIPNGMSWGKFVDSKIDFRKLFGVGNGFLVLYVARYDDSKNQAAALRAFLQADLENSTLILIGDQFNAYSRWLQDLHQRLADTFPKGRVIFLEKLERNMIAAAYRAADLFLMPSKAEVQPLVILDAMACGMPFVASDVGCVAELPGGVTVKSENEMAARIKEFYSSLEMRSKFGRAGLHASQTTFNWGSVISAYEQLFETLAKTGANCR